MVSVISDKPLNVRHKQFEYGPLAEGTYYALVSITLVIPFYDFSWLKWHLALLLFLGVGLRPLLERSGLYRWLVHIQVLSMQRIGKQFDAGNEQKVERKMRDDRYRHRRKKHPDLPRNW